MKERPARDARRLSPAGAPAAAQCESAQLSAAPVSTTSGMASSAALSITEAMRARVSSNFSLRHLEKQFVVDLEDHSRPQACFGECRRGRAAWRA